MVLTAFLVCFFQFTQNIIGITAICQYFSISFIDHHLGAGLFFDGCHRAYMVKVRMCGQQYFNILKFESQCSYMRADQWTGVIQSRID